MLEKPMYVFVNSDKVELLEDRRLALYHHYPEGTVLMDPSFYPPRAIPLSDDPEEYGVTARKLLPRMQYHAFLVDPHSGERTPVSQNSYQKILIVHNLPANATSEFVGRFFEQFDMIVECDVMKSVSLPPQHPQCKGRAYVIFNDPKTVDLMLESYKTLSFFGEIVYLDSSDRVPKASVVPPPSYQHSAMAHDSAHHSNGNGTTTSSSSHYTPSSGSGFIDPRLQMMQDSRRTQQQGNVSIPSAPAAVATVDNNYYFVTHIFEEHIQTSVRDGIFWPTKVNQRAFYAALERGAVVLIFMVVQREALFGYARLTPRDMVRNKHANFTLDWVKHSLFLSEEDLRPLGVPVLGFADGTALKPDLGQQICEFADKFQARKCPDSIPRVQPVPQNQNATRPPVRQVPTTTIQPPAPASQQRAAMLQHNSVLQPHHHHHHHHIHQHHQAMLPPPNLPPRGIGPTANGPPPPRSAMLGAGGGPMPRPYGGVELKRSPLAPPLQPRWREGEV